MCHCTKPKPVEGLQDKELLANPDQRAWEGLCQYKSRLVITLRRKFGSRLSAHDLEDIVQETLLRAFIQADRYDPERSSVWTWLSMLAHYNALSFLRHHLHYSDLTLDQIADTAAAETEEYCVVDLQQPSPEMEQVLQKLPPRRAEMIRLHYYEGVTYEELAARFKVRPSTVESYLSRARTQLKRLIQDLHQHNKRN